MPFLAASEAHLLFTDAYDLVLARAPWFSDNVVTVSFAAPFQVLVLPHDHVFLHLTKLVSV